MKILITGIDGFIGRNISARLSGDGHEVVGLSNGSGSSAIPPLKKGVRGIDEGGESFSYKFHRADVTDRDAIFSVFEEEKPDMTIHLAAMAHADVGPEKEALVRAVNVDGSINVFDACAAAGCNKLIYFSSVKALADVTDENGIDEETEPNPRGVYAALKLEVEREVLKRCKEGTLVASIARPVAVIGFGDDKGNYAKLMQMVKRGFFPVLDQGRARRSIVFAGRVAERVSMMIDKGLVSGRAYVFSDGTFSIREIVDAMRSATGYALCPSVPVDLLRAAGPFADRVFGKFRPGSAPVENMLKRLTSSFVVKTHLFEEDYGALPKLELVEEMRTACL